MIQTMIPLMLCAVVQAPGEGGEEQAMVSGADDSTTAAAPVAAGAEGPLPAPAPPVSQTRDAEPAPRKRGPGLGLTISGFSMFGISYVGSALVGAMAYDLGDDRASRAYGRRMMIPVGGPFAAAGQSSSLTIGILTGMAGVVQVAGLGLGITGTVLLAREKAQASPRLAFGATPTRGGGHFSATLRF